MKIFDPYSNRIVEQVIINVTIIDSNGDDVLEHWLIQTYIMCPETFRLIYQTQLDNENYESLIVLKRIIQNIELPLGHA